MHLHTPFIPNKEGICHNYLPKPVVDGWPKVSPVPVCPEGLFPNKPPVDKVFCWPNVRPVLVVG